jgi:hypothetical protein
MGDSGTLRRKIALAIYENLCKQADVDGGGFVGHWFGDLTVNYIDTVCTDLGETADAVLKILAENADD